MRLSTLAAAVAVLSVSLAARADDLFTLNDGTNTITFQLPSMPTVIPGGICGSDANFFCVYDTPVTVDGVTGTSDYIAFYDASEFGGLTIDEGGTYLIAQSGPALFTNGTTNPVFLTGDFTLANYTGQTALLSSDFTANISPTPEPSSIALLGTGLLGVAGAMKRRFA